MGLQFRIASAALAMGVLFAPAAFAQDNRITLPPIDVTSTLGAGIAGTSTTVISAEDLRRAPESTLQEILGREAGMQTTSLYGGVNGTGSTIDLRGFGVALPSNVLVLVDGRRFNDSDLTGFDFSLIPRNSIDHIEITRGNSGAVLYGDGAVGGVINIVTKNGVGAASNARVEAGFGTFATADGKVSASASSGPFSTAVFGNVFRSNGYRDNNKTTQSQGVGDICYTGKDGSVFFNIFGDDLNQHLPGPRLHRQWAVCRIFQSIFDRPDRDQHAARQHQAGECRAARRRHPQSRQRGGINPRRQRAAQGHTLCQLQSVRRVSRAEWPVLI